MDDRGVPQGLENRLPGRAAAAGGGRSAGAAARALAIVAVRLLGLRDAARRDGGAPVDVPETTIRILAAKLQQTADCFTTNRDFLRGVARLGGFLARKSDGEPGWQTIWKGWFVLMILVEGYELAQAITSPK